MNATITIDRAGRIVLPKSVREELQVGPGDSLELETSEERIVLRPAHGNGRMKKEHGVWVFDSSIPMGPELPRKVLDKIRRERARKALGKQS
ncbi:MAG TPA: AbrB/MazE/SpoVT family DNA-binding domain-containing protein [Terriglobales bacterium]|nr:AbrB/MazE/SpoVT family DNA-binding domain-containing protein [Terriglobales bacterium]